MRKNTDYIKAKEALIHSEIAALLDSNEDLPVVGFHGGLVNPVEFKEWQLKALKFIKKAPIALTAIRFKLSRMAMCYACNKMFDQGVITCSRDAKRFVFCRMVKEGLIA